MTERTVTVASQAEAEALRDYVLMSVYSARASVSAPVVNVQPAQIEIINQIALPTRKTDTVVTRDQKGNIVSASATETTV